MTDAASPEDQGARRPPRVFISFAHESQEHEDLVRDFWLFLRGQRIDAKIDLPAGEQRQNWPVWMERQLAEADFVAVVASPEYRRRAGPYPPADQGHGVRWEGRMLRDRVYDDPDWAIAHVVPVVLPGRSADELPEFLRPRSETWFSVSEFTLSGAEKLLRFITGQPYETEPPLGDKSPDLRPRGTGGPPPSRPPVSRRSRIR